MELYKIYKFSQNLHSLNLKWLIKQQLHFNVHKKFILYSVNLQDLKYNFQILKEELML
jgi:hypothetical protein